ncbi:MAG: hypothetical protein K6E36_01590 [Oscillospiraceae bacterium]|nr:hypothetical protein [Oscillospiraceae bacterium]
MKYEKAVKGKRKELKMKEARKAMHTKPGAAGWRAASCSVPDSTPQRSGEKEHYGHQRYIIDNNGEILYDGGDYSIAHFRDGRYWLAAEHHACCDFDSTPLWSYSLSREQAEDFLAHPEKIVPFYLKMVKEYPFGHSQ